MRRTLVIVAFVMALSGFIDVQKASGQGSGGGGGFVGVAVDVFMLTPPIVGDSTEVNHTGWIDILSLSQTLEQASTNAGGAQQNGSVNCEIEVVKFLDRSGPLLWAAAVTGHVFSEIRIDMTTKGLEGDRVKLYEIKLINVQISSISTATESPGIPSEKVALRAASAILTYIPLIRTQAPVTSTISCNPNKVK